MVEGYTVHFAAPGQWMRSKSSQGSRSRTAVAAFIAAAVPCCKAEAKVGQEVMSSSGASSVAELPAASEAEAATEVWVANLIRRNFAGQEYVIVC